jgi:hypothetical protein
LPCIPPEHPSNFHLGGPNRKNRVEGKRIEKIVDISNYCSLRREFCLCTAGEQSALRAVAQCAGDPHHRHCKQLEIERFWAAFLFLLSFLYFGVFWEDIDDGFGVL